MEFIKDNKDAGDIHKELKDMGIPVEYVVKTGTKCKISLKEEITQKQKDDIIEKMKELDLKEKKSE